MLPLLCYAPTYVAHMTSWCVVGSPSCFELYGKRCKRGEKRSTDGISRYVLLWRSSGHNCPLNINAFCFVIVRMSPQPASRKNVGDCGSLGSCNEELDAKWRTLSLIRSSSSSSWMTINSFSVPFVLRLFGWYVAGGESIAVTELLFTVVTALRCVCASTMVFAPSP